MYHTLNPTIESSANHIGNMLSKLFTPKMVACPACDSNDNDCSLCYGSHEVTKKEADQYLEVLMPNTDSNEPNA